MSSNTKPGVNPNESGHVTSKKRFLLKFYEIYPFQRKTVSKLTWLSPTVAHVTKPRDYVGYFQVQYWRVSIYLTNNIHQLYSH